MSMQIIKDTESRKRRYRKRIFRRLNALGPRQQRSMDRKIRRQLLKFIKETEIKRLFVFASLYDEPGLWPLYTNLDTKGTKLIFPKVNGRNLSYYAARRPVKRSNGFTTGAFGILEPDCPKGKSPIKPRKGDYILVPCAAADMDCHRLGRGGGYYDRFLKKYRGLLTIGVLYAAQIIRSTPRLRHDIRLNFLVTEKGMVNVSGNRKWEMGNSM